MNSRLRRYATLVLIAGIFAFITGASSPSSLADRAPANIHAVTVVASSGLASNPTVFRLRRLHLVRPDLIPYPIDYEVIC